MIPADIAAKPIEDPEVSRLLSGAKSTATRAGAMDLDQQFEFGRACIAAATVADLPEWIRDLIAAELTAVDVTKA